MSELNMAQAKEKFSEIESGKYRVLFASFMFGAGRMEDQYGYTLTDQNGNPLPYYFGALDVKTGGDIEIIGETPVILRAGMGGFYVRTKRKPGKAFVTMSADGCESVTVDFTITVKGEV